MIIIPVIICLVALARGTQYTKRLLPEFLTPHSVIRLDYLVEAADLPESKRTEDAVCHLLGCIDPLHLVGHRGEWYLLCWSHHHEEVWIYALFRIKQTRLRKETFTRPEGFAGTAERYQ